MPRTKHGHIFLQTTERLNETVMAHIAKNGRPLSKKEWANHLGVTEAKASSLVQSWTQAAINHPEDDSFPRVCGSRWWGTLEQQNALAAAGWANGRNADGKKGLNTKKLTSFFTVKKSRTGTTCQGFKANDDVVVPSEAAIKAFPGLVKQRLEQQAAPDFSEVAASLDVPMSDEHDVTLNIKADLSHGVAISRILDGASAFTMNVNGLDLTFAMRNGGVYLTFDV